MYKYGLWIQCSFFVGAQTLCTGISALPLAKKKNIKRNTENSEGAHACMYIHAGA